MAAASPSNNGFAFATMVKMTEDGREGESFTVQFNPSEYRLERGLSMSKRKPLGKGQKAETQPPVSGETSRLSLSLYFDTMTDISRLQQQKAEHNWEQILNDESGQSEAGNAKSNPANTDKNGDKQSIVGSDFMQFVSYDPTTHEPYLMRFIWGPFAFEGYVKGCSASYVMFHANGTPIRCKIDILMHGEEVALVEKMASEPNQSPDRTKHRTLVEGDQLWMLANKEYADPGMWREIANANKILNPRKLTKAAGLKVPAIK